MRFSRITVSAFLTVLAIAQPLDSRASTLPVALSYADSADLALAAPVAAHVQVRRSILLRERDATGVPSGHRRFYVEADVLSLIRGADGLPAQISYLVDLPNDARGRAAKIERRSAFIILAALVLNRPGELRLIAPDAQIPFTEAGAERIRSILREANRPDAPPRITGIGRAFHVPGSLPGESETQIFLQTADNRPVSINVLRRPGEQPRWAVALSEMVDDSAAAPEADSLLWYRLACTLPRTLPRQSLSEPGQAQAIQADYRLVIERLGPCVRNRTQR